MHIHVSIYTHHIHVSLFKYIHKYTYKIYKIHHSMWTHQASTRYANDFYEFKLVILVAILDFGLA